MTGKILVCDLNSSREFFERSTRCLTEENSGACPAPGMMTAAQQVAHCAQTIDWFVEGASRPEGFDLDFEKHMTALTAVTSLTAAREWLDRSYAKAVKFFGEASDEELARPLPPGPVMGGVPIWGCVGAIVDHSAHHRGALTVYSRLAGKTPMMPYGEMTETAQA